MGLFSDPQVINDGTNAHTFHHRGQLPNAKSIVSEYFEPAAIANDVKITAKYEASNSPAQRSVISTTCLIPDGAGVLKKCTFNTSVAHDKGCNIADVEEKFKLHTAALAIAGVLTRLLQRMP